VNRRLGSLFQLVVGATLSMLSLTMSAWFRPYENDIANNFKVATEVSLVMTLTLAILLKINEDDLEKEGLTTGFIGACMMVQTVILPSATLILAVLLSGHELKEEHSAIAGGDDARSRAGPGKFSNPLHPQDSNDTSASEEADEETDEEADLDAMGSD
jgi:hypothetical protein